MTVIDLDRIVGSIRQIPPMPATAIHLVSRISDPDHALSEVTGIVESDSDITAYVLKVANSAYAAQREPVTSVKNAIMLLGENMIISAALRACASGIFERSLSGYDAGRKDLWKHSLATAVAARILSGYLRDKGETEAVYTAGIMHDIGKVVISEFLVEESEGFEEILHSGRQNDFMAAERELLGTDHCEVGALLAEKWNFPESIISVIRYHHIPADAPQQFRQIVYIAHLADAIAMMSGSSTGSDGMQYKLDMEYSSYIDCSDRDIEEVLLSTELEVEKIFSLMFGDS